MEKWQVNARERAVAMPLGPRGEWTVEMQWPREGGTQGGPALLVIRPSEFADGYPPGGLSQTLLREVDFKEALHALRNELGRSSSQRDERILPLLVEQAEGGKITDEYLALLSRIYVGIVNDGQDKPLDVLAKMTDNSHAAIKNHLWQATRKGFLERSPGRAGGRITSKAADLIAEMLGVNIGESPAQTLRKARGVVSDT